MYTYIYICLKKIVPSVIISQSKGSLAARIMENFVPIITLYCVLLVFLHEGTSLRCRSGNGQMDAHFQKVLKTCRDRNTDLNSSDSEDSTSAEHSNSESNSSDEKDVYDKNFFNKKNDRSSYNRSSDNQKYRNAVRNSDVNTYSTDQLNNGNTHDFQNFEQNRRSNYRDSWNSENSRNSKNNFDNGDTKNGDMHFKNTDQDQGCIIQCFFNELNAVNRKGFPERDLVVPLMSQGIQDPELKDFVEESVIECFRYLESNKREKCEFSQKLMMCLAEKGKQKCDDWEN